MEGLTRAARIYIGAVCAIGLAVFYMVSWIYPATITPEFLVLLVLTAVVGNRTVKLAHKVELSVAHPFIYAGLLLCGVFEAVALTMVTVVGTCLMRRRPMSPVRCAFNVSALTLTTWVSAEVYLQAGGVIGDVTLGETLVPLLVSTFVYYLLNTILVSMAIALWRSMHTPRVWLENFLWTAPSYFAGSSIALVTALFVIHFGLYSFLLTLPPALLIFYSYRLYLDRLNERHKRFEQIKSLNEKLEKKVQERTEELNTLNEQLQISNRQLQSANRLKSQFLANMSHELRTPLNAVIGFSEVLMEDASSTLTDTQREYIGDIHASGKHLLALINDILDLSKVEAGKVTYEPGEASLEPIIHQSLVFVEGMARKKRISITVDVDPDLPAVYADPAKLKQIFYNLLSNAVKFTPDGGNVGVEAHRDGPLARIAVRDDGIGIRPEDQERIFGEFIQVDESYARKFQGTGLGLALVKRFVEMHGSRITVSSAPGKGTVFYFHLAFAGELGNRPKDGVDFGPWDEETAAPVDQIPVAVSEAPGRVLVVEDNPTSMKLARLLLEKKGLEVLEATTGERGLEMARSERPDLVLLDIQLPGMDGFSVIRQLRGDPGTRAIPTVALTAHAMKGDRERALRAGFLGYITKPFQSGEFLEAVATHLNGDKKPGGCPQGEGA